MDYPSKIPFTPFVYTTYHDLTDWINLTLDTSDITLTGLKTSKTETGEDGQQTERGGFTGR